MKDIIIFDGAFGTYIASKNVSLPFPEMANITAPELVEGIHNEYISIGVDAIKTNTFGANLGTVADYPTLERILQAGFDIASRAASASGAKVFADIGPVNSETASDEYMRIAGVFLERGAHYFLFETLGEVRNLQHAITQIKKCLPDSVVIASFAVTQDGYTKTGEHYEALFDRAVSYGADYVGLNCICGPSHILNLIKNLPHGKYRLSAMPNSGYPTAVNGRTVFIDNPDYYSEKLYEIYSYGAKILGGCCGTTPEHIRKFKQKLESSELPNVQTADRKTVKKAAVRNSFGKEGITIAVEISAPSDADISYSLEAAKKAKDHGADFVTVPDSPLGKTRANSLMVSSMIQRTVGIAAIPHLCCRDKNQIAIKGDLIAANIEGISTVLAITGDPIAEVSRNEAKNVFGFNSYKLINFIKNLNDSVFHDNPYTICAALNTSADNFGAELERAGEKITRGASCLLTQPIFSDTSIGNLLAARKALKCKILASILPLAGYRNALFLDNEMPGIEIPDDIIMSLENKNAQEVKEISIGYAKSIIKRIKSSCDGYYLVTQLKKIDYTMELIRHIKGN